MPGTAELAYFAKLISDSIPASDTIVEPASLGLSDDQYLKRLDYHGITLLAAHKGRLPDPLLAKAKQRRAMMAANETLKKTALIELFDAFDEAGLSCVLFKGSALAYTLYPQPWLRPRSDSDVLINPKQIDKFAAVFSRLGFEKQFAIEGKYVSYQSSFSKALAGQSTVHIDLHWRINNRQSLSKSYTVEQLSRDGQTLPTLANNTVAPNHVDSLLIASLHRLGHHQSEERIIWLYDVHLLANSLERSQWQTLVKKAQDKRLCAVTLDALQTSNHWLKTELPDFVIEGLQTNQHEISRIFLQRDLPEWRYFLSDLASMPSLRAKLGLMRENIFPNPNYVKQQMNSNSAVAAYIKRFIRGVKRVMNIG